MTITPGSNSGLNLIGPGTIISLQSDVGSGATPSGTNWWIMPYNLEGIGNGWRYVVPAPTYGPTFFKFGDPSFGGENVIFDTAGLQDSTEVGLNISLVTPTTHLDDTTVASGWKWQGDASAAWTTTVQPSGGLTDTQATQLANASDNSDTNLSLWDTFTSVTLPSLNDLINSIVTGITATLHTSDGDVPTTLATFFEQWERNVLLQQEITDGPTCESINADISHGTFFSLVLVITSYPSDWYFGGPGQTWGPADLAVLRILRGGNEVFRTGIHTTSYTVAPLPDVVVGPETFGNPVTPLDYHVLVDPAPGVCFQLYVEGLP